MNNLRVTATESDLARLQRIGHLHFRADQDRIVTVEMEGDDE